MEVVDQCKRIEEILFQFDYFLGCTNKGKI